MTNAKRLANTFVELVRIDSVSKHEAELARVLEKKFINMGLEVSFDRASEAVGGNCSNLIAKFKGNTSANPLFLSGHMDMVWLLILSPSMMCILAMSPSDYRIWRIQRICFLKLFRFMYWESKFR